MKKIVLLRHGESIWNKENRFTGWTDVPLSEKGIQEAGEAGRLLREEGFTFDIAYTSVLKRAIKTLWIVLEEMDLMWIPVIHSWRLNERHYGALQGLNKSEAAKELGEEQVKLWRRSFDVPPPLLKLDDPRHPKPIAEFTEGMEAGVHSAFIYRQAPFGTHVFATNDGTGAIHVINIDDPAHPREVARWRTDRPDDGRTLHDVDVQDGESC